MNKWKKAVIDTYYIITLCLMFGFFTTFGATMALKITGFEGINQINVVINDKQTKVNNNDT